MYEARRYEATASPTRSPPSSAPRGDTSARARTCYVVRNGTAGVGRAIACPASLQQLLRDAGAALGGFVAHAAWDDEGNPVSGVHDVRDSQRLYVSTTPDEPFLRQRPRRCQLFRLAAPEVSVR
jgi:hypothetical protein